MVAPLRIRPERKMGMVSSMFNSVSGKRIALLGFAFKKDTADVRETAAAYVSKFLLEERAHLRVYDPKVRLPAMLSELDYTCGVTPENCPDLAVSSALCRRAAAFAPLVPARPRPRPNAPACACFPGSRDALVLPCLRSEPQRWPGSRVRSLVCCLVLLPLRARSRRRALCRAPPLWRLATAPTPWQS